MKLRHTFIPLLLAGTLAGRVSLNTSKPPVVRQGATYRFTANTAVIWSMAPGSRGTIDADGTYHAPAHVDVKHQMAGCQVLPNNHIFNTRIDNLPVHPRSSDWINDGLNSMGGKSLKYSPVFGLNIVTNETPVQPLHFLYTPLNEGAFPFIPGLPGSFVESGKFVTYKADTDRHITSVNRDNCTFYEVYNAYPAGWNEKCPACTAQSGLSYGFSYDLPAHGATDAAGMPLLPLSLHLEEIKKGAINHAVRFTRVHPDQNFIWPATASAYYGRVDGRMQMGARLRLKASFDISAFSPIARVLLTQLKQYGLILADAGLNWDIGTMIDFGADPDVVAAFAEIRAKVSGLDLEVVDESSLMVSSGSGEAAVDREVVIATSQNNPSDQARISVILESVTVGVEYNWETIQSGVTKKMKAWVHGTPDTSVTWSMKPALGTLTADGVYTAPEVTKPQTTVITGASVADPEASTNVFVTVIPAGPIRMVVCPSKGPKVPRVGSAYGPDSQGNMWWKDVASESIPICADEWYGKPWPAIPDISLYYASGYTYSDWFHRLNVPNGDYKITLQVARSAVVPDGITIPCYIETQGQLVLKSFDEKTAAGNIPQIPITIDIPAQVKDGTLYFVLRNLREAARTSPAYWPPSLSAFQVVADSSPPHLAVNPPSLPTHLATGGSWQFQAVGWHLPNTVRWSISPPIGSIDQDGTYLAPSTAFPEGTVVTVKAASTVDPAKTAEARLTLTFGTMNVSPGSGSMERSLTRKFGVTINGVPYSRVSWAVSPPLGSIDASGLYTAPDTLEHDTPVQIKASSIDDPVKSAVASVTVLAVPRPIRVRCGITADLKDAQGNIWSADYGFSLPSMRYGNNVPIAGAPPDLQPLYQASRYRYTNEDFNYTFSVPNGTYRVTLKFADYASNTRIPHNFDVKINGADVLKNFDPDVAAGTFRTAVDRTFVTTVSNKTIRIDFIGHQGGAMINGIEILPESSDQQPAAARHNVP